MNHNTQWLDEIFDNLDLRVDEGQAYLYDSTEAKQAILQWVNDEVIGENRRTAFGNKPSDHSPYAFQNELRAEQRNILKQYGWKESK